MMTSQRRGQNIWIDSGSGFIGATWYWPQATSASTTVVIVPGIVHEERTMNGGLVALAESLADAGVPALLIDLHGSSQSAGRLEDADIGAHWRGDIRSAVRHARDNGAARVIVIGVRLGFPLVVEALSDEPLAAMIAWAPITSGKRYVRELRMLQRTTDEDATAAGTIAIGGFSIAAPVLEYIATLDLTKIETLKAPFVMVREMPEGWNAPWVSRLSERGVTVQEQISTQIYPWLFGATDQPDLPHEDIHALSRWCRVLHDEQTSGPQPIPNRPAPRPVIEFVHKGRRVRETFVEIAPNGLTGIISEPAGSPGGHPVRLMMSTIGPGRTFADFARDEASRGNTSLRFDFSGFGTSGRGNAVQGGELYNDDGCHDVLAAIDYLRQAGHQQIYTLGFCAGAWSMLQADVAPELCAVAAINVALYRQPGRASPDLVRKTGRRVARLLPMLARNPLLRGVAAQVQRTASKRREPIEWLVRWCNDDVPVLLAYAEQDPGLDYLQIQMAKGVRKQLRQPFTLRTYDGLGHLAEGPSARGRLFQDITAFFASLDREIVRSRKSSGASPPSASLPRRALSA